MKFHKIKPVRPTIIWGKDLWKEIIDFIRMNNSSHSFSKPKLNIFGKQINTFHFSLFFFLNTWCPFICDSNKKMQSFFFTSRKIDMGNKNSNLNNCKEQCQIIVWSKNIFSLLRTLTSYSIRQIIATNKWFQTMHHVIWIDYNHKQQILCIIER